MTKNRTKAKMVSLSLAISKTITNTTFSVRTKTE